MKRRKRGRILCGSTGDNNLESESATQRIEVGSGAKIIICCGTELYSPTANPPYSIDNNFGFRRPVPENSANLSDPSMTA
jgi:hypothetical protein